MTTTGDVDLVFLVVRRKKRSIFLEAPSTTNVAEVKKMLEGIIKVPPYNQRLYLNMHGDEEMEDDKDLAFYGINIHFHICCKFTLRFHIVNGGLKEKLKLDTNFIFITIMITSEAWPEGRTTPVFL